MDTYSTQAVEADTTLNATPVKRWKRGDVREDGMVFWAHAASCVNGEYWATPETFAAGKAKEAKRKANFYAKKASSLIKLHRGSLREDGMVFWGYDVNCADGERWLAPERFAAEKAKKTEKRAKFFAKKAALPIKLRRGYVREDGMVFWGYALGYPNGEWWMTSEQFAEEKSKRNARDRARRAKDPLCSIKDRLRSRMYSALKTKGIRKSSKTEAMLGCTFKEFKDCLESKFLPGMSWGNRPDWHIDHIVPCAAATDARELESLFHFTNLRPMWGRDNCSKNAKLPEEHELPAELNNEVRKIWQRAKDSACTK